MSTSQGTASPPNERFISGMIGEIAATFGLVSFAVASVPSIWYHHTHLVLLVQRE